MNTDKGYNTIIGETVEVWRVTGVAILYRSRQRSGTYYLLKNPSDSKADGIELTAREAKELGEILLSETGG